MKRLENGGDHPRHPASRSSRGRTIPLCLLSCDWVTNLHNQLQSTKQKPSHCSGRHSVSATRVWESVTVHVLEAKSSVPRTGMYLFLAITFIDFVALQFSGYFLGHEKVKRLFSTYRSLYGDISIRTQLIQIT